MQPKSILFLVLVLFSPVSYSDASKENKDVQHLYKKAHKNKTTIKKWMNLYLDGNIFIAELIQIGAIPGTKKYSKFQITTDDKAGKELDHLDSLYPFYGRYKATTEDGKYEYRFIASKYSERSLWQLKKAVKHNINSGNNLMIKLPIEKATREANGLLKSYKASNDVSPANNSLENQIDAGLRKFSKEYKKQENVERSSGPVFTVLDVGVIEKDQAKSKSKPFSRISNIVEACLGNSFGIAFSVTGLKPGHQIKVNKIVSHPPVNTKKDGISRGYTVSEITTADEDGEISGITGYGFDYPYELVEGEWTIELWIGKDRMTRETFDIVPCTKDRNQ